MSDPEGRSKARSPSADSFRFEPEEFSVKSLFKIDFKYLEKCIAFLVNQEKEHGHRIQALEVRLDAEQARVEEFSRDIVGIRSTCTQVESAVTHMREQLASVESRQQTQAEEVQSLCTRYENLASAREQDRVQDAAERERSQESSHRQERQLEHTANLTANLAANLEATTGKAETLAQRIDAVAGTTERLEGQIAMQTQSRATMDEALQKAQLFQEEAARESASLREGLEDLEAALCKLKTRLCRVAIIIVS